MDLDDFLLRCDAYCCRSGMSIARLSTIIFGSGVTIGRLRRGAGVTLRVLARANTLLSERESALVSGPTLEAARKSA